MGDGTTDIVTTDAGDTNDVITLEVGIFTLVTLEVGATTIDVVAEEKHNFHNYSNTHACNCKIQ